MARFAENTEVPVERSRAEIERLIVRYGATTTAFFNSTDKARIMFEAHERRIMFELSLPDQSAEEFKRDGTNRLRSHERRRAAWEQACRQRWRAFALVIKAKLEAVESGITAFEDEFLAHIVMPDGKTISQHVRPRIAQAYSDGKMTPLLPPTAQ